MKNLKLSLGIATTGVLLSATSAFADSEEGVITAYSLNVRQEPSTKSVILTKLKKDELVKILESKNGWYKIQTNNGIVGWSSSNYIETTNKDLNIEIDKVKSSINNDIGVVTASILNLRSGEGTNNSILSKLKRDEIVTVLSENNGWYKVKTSNNTIGYVSVNYIDVKDDEQEENKQNNNFNIISKIGTVKVSKNDLLNVREGIGTKFNILDKLPNDSKVEILESKNGWYKIQTDNNIVGYVNGRYISLSDNSNENNDNSNTNIDTSTVYNSSEYNTSKEVLNDIINLTFSQLGKPYVWGSEGPNSFDCSGLVYYVFKEAANINLPRTSKEQFTIGESIKKEDLQIGDLIFSSSREDKVVTHVGIYLGDNKMIHSPHTGKNVEIKTLNDTYWNSFVGAKRIL